MSNSQDRIVAHAKKSARRMARATDASYQSCLDQIARSVGRAHWGAYIADPVAIVHAAPGGDLPTMRDVVPEGIPEDDVKTTTVVAEDDGTQHPSTQARQADAILMETLRHAIDSDADALVLEMGRLTAWNVEHDGWTHVLADGMDRYLHGAMSRLAGADIRQNGPFPFKHEGRPCAFVMGVGIEAGISLRGTELLEGNDLFASRRQGTSRRGIAFESGIRESGTRTRSGNGRKLRRIGGFRSTLLNVFGIGPNARALRQGSKARLVTTRKDEGAYTLGSTVEGKALRLEKALPVLVVAPPGTGKTAGAVIPAILTADTSSLVVHDDREVWIATSGHRAELGPVHVVNLGGPSTGSLNPLHADWLPGDPARRFAYLSAIAAAVLDTNERDREYLTQALLETVETCPEATFSKTWALLKGREAQASPEDRRLGTDAQRAGYVASALSFMLGSWTVRCTQDAGLKPEDLRGVREVTTDGPGSWRPTTLYVLRNHVDSDRQGRAAAVLQAAIWQHALASRPREIAPDGTVNGPLGMQIVIDDCTRMPIMPMLPTALDAGRGADVGHMLVSSSIRSMRTIFTRRHRESMRDLFAVQIVFRQNDVDAARDIADRYEDLPVCEIVSMPFGRHMIVLQNVEDPLWVWTPMLWTRPDVLDRTYNVRTRRGPRPVVLKDDGASI